MDDENRRRKRRRRILGAIMFIGCTTIVAVVVLPIVLAHHKEDKGKTSDDVAIDNSLFKNDNGPENDNLLNNSKATPSTQTNNSIPISIKPLIFDAIMSNLNTVSEIPTNKPSEEIDNSTVAPDLKLTLAVNTSTTMNEQIYHNNQTSPTPTVSEITDVLSSSLSSSNEHDIIITVTTNEEASSTMTNNQLLSVTTVIDNQITEPVSISVLISNETQSHLPNFSSNINEESTNYPYNSGISTTRTIENELPNNTEYNNLLENTSFVDTFNSETGSLNSTQNDLQNGLASNIPDSSTPGSINDLSSNLENKYPPSHLDNGFAPNLDDNLEQSLLQPNPPNNDSNITYNQEANDSASADVSIFASLDNTTIENEAISSTSETTDPQQATFVNIDTTNNKPIPNRCLNFNFNNNNK